MDASEIARINRGLAERLGWTLVDHEMFTADPCELWLDLKTGYPVCKASDFSPATSSDHLREYVLPEVRRRGLVRQFENGLAECDIWTDGESWFASLGVLMAHPFAIASAALKVLGGGE